MSEDDHHNIFHLFHLLPIKWTCEITSSNGRSTQKKWGRIWWDIIYHPYNAKCSQKQCHNERTVHWELLLQLLQHPRLMKTRMWTVLEILPTMDNRPVGNQVLEHHSTILAQLGARLLIALLNIILCWRQGSCVLLLSLSYQRWYIVENWEVRHANLNCNVF